MPSPPLTLRPSSRALKKLRCVSRTLAFATELTSGLSIKGRLPRGLGRKQVEQERLDEQLVHLCRVEVPTFVAPPGKSSTSKRILKLTVLIAAPRIPRLEYITIINMERIHNQLVARDKVDACKAIIAKGKEPSVKGGGGDVVKVSKTSEPSPPE